MFGVKALDFYLHHRPFLFGTSGFLKTIPLKSKPFARIEGGRGCDAEGEGKKQKAFTPNVLTIILLQRVGEAVKAKNKNHLKRTRARERRKTRKRRTKARVVCAESSPLLRAASRGLLVRDNLPSGRANSKAHIRRSDEAARVELFATRTSCDRQTKIVSRQRRERTATFRMRLSYPVRK